MMFCYRLIESRIGRAWEAIREDELAAAANGINTVIAKLLAFALGASTAGIAGVFNASKLVTVSPDQFTFVISFTVLAMVVLGGMGNFWGVAVGAFVIYTINNVLLKSLNQFFDTAGIPILQDIDFIQLQFLLYGLALVGMMLLRPEGLFPNSRRRSASSTRRSTESERGRAGIRRRHHRGGPSGMSADVLENRPHPRGGPGHPPLRRPGRGQRGRLHHPGALDRQPHRARTAPARRRSSTSCWASSTPSSGEVQFQGRRMIARPERIAFESIVWVAPALDRRRARGDPVRARASSRAGCFALVGFIALMLLVATLLLVDHPARLVPEAAGALRHLPQRAAQRHGRGGRRPDVPEHPAVPEHDRRREHARRHAHPAQRATSVDALFNTPGAKREEDKAERRAEELLKLVGLQGKGNEAARNLPYGDQRRLEIARALAADPKLLLLDEPAAGMNPKETQDLVRLISRLRSDLGLTILLIEHDMKLVMGISDRITVLDHGEKISEGTPEEVRKDPAGHRGLPGGAGRMTAPRSAPAPASADAVLRLTDVNTYYGAIHALRGLNVEVRARRDRHAHRRQRRRQDDDPAHDLAACSTHARARSSSTGVDITKTRSPRARHAGASATRPRAAGSSRG